MERVSVDLGQKLFEQAHEFWIKNAYEAQKIKEPIFCYLILFRENGVEVKFNQATGLIISFSDNPFRKGEMVDLEKYLNLQIKDIKVPEQYRDFGYIAAAWTRKSKWFLKFDFRKGKTKALSYVNRAEAFYKSAVATDEDSVRSYNCYHALEQLACAFLIQFENSGFRVDNLKKHHAIKSKINILGKNGNFHEELLDAFNKLIDKRDTIYGKDKPNILLTEKALEKIPEVISLFRNTFSL